METYRVDELYPYNLMRSIVKHWDKETKNIFFNTMTTMDMSELIEDLMEELNDTEKIVIHRVYFDKWQYETIEERHKLRKLAVYIKNDGIEKMSKSSKLAFIYKCLNAENTYRDRVNKCLNARGSDEILKLPIHEIGLSARAENCLKYRFSYCRPRECVTLGDIVSLSYEQLCNVRNAGEKTVNEILNKVAEYGYTFKMDKNRN